MSFESYPGFLSSSLLHYVLVDFLLYLKSPNSGSELVGEGERLTILETALVVTAGEMGVLLGSAGQRPGVLINIVQRPDNYTWQRMIQPKYP